MVRMAFGDNWVWKSRLRSGSGRLGRCLRIGAGRLFSPSGGDGRYGGRPAGSCRRPASVGALPATGPPFTNRQSWQLPNSCTSFTGTLVGCPLTPNGEVMPRACSAAAIPVSVKVKASPDAVREIPMTRVPVARTTTPFGARPVSCSDPSATVITIFSPAGVETLINPFGRAGDCVGENAHWSLYAGRGASLGPPWVTLRYQDP